MVFMLLRFACDYDSLCDRPSPEEQSKQKLDHHHFRDIERGTSNPPMYLLVHAAR